MGISQVDQGEWEAGEWGGGCAGKGGQREKSKVPGTIFRETINKGCTRSCPGTRPVHWPGMPPVEPPSFVFTRNVFHDATDSSRCSSGRPGMQDGPSELLDGPVEQLGLMAGLMGA